MFDKNYQKFRINLEFYAFEDPPSQTISRGSTTHGAVLKPPPDIAEYMRKGRKICNVLTNYCLIKTNKCRRINSCCSKIKANRHEQLLLFVISRNSCSCSLDNLPVSLCMYLSAVNFRPCGTASHPQRLHFS